MVSNDRDEMSRFVTDASEDIEEECFTTMLHDNMNPSRLLVHDQQVGDSCLRKKNMKARREGLQKVVLLRVGLMFKTSLSSRRGFQIMFLLISRRIQMIEVLILSLKRAERLIHQKKDQLVVSVV